MYCSKVCFLRTVKYNNFVLYDLSLFYCGPEKRQCYPEKEKICPEKEECGPEKGLLWRRGAQNISVTNMSEEIHVKICISIQLYV